MMKLGLGLSPHLQTRENFRFARQMGCTHLVAHLTDYASRVLDLEWLKEQYTYDHLVRLKKAINEEGLELHALENFSPADWSDILLDGPKKQQQMEHVKSIIRNVGKAGIPLFGYNFSIAGVWGLTNAQVARGHASTAVFHQPEQTPIPRGMVWNFVYDTNETEDTLGEVTTEQLWSRLASFLQEIIPVAEEAGVTMAAHPDDPPLPTLRGTARLVYQPRLYQKLLDTVVSSRNALEFCLGTTQEMSEGDVYSAIEQYASHIAYVHFRNVRGKVPNYDEVFLDEGDIDMLKALRLFKKHAFSGVFIPDHTPATACAAPWHAGMAYALGYMKAAMTLIEQEASHLC